MTPLDLNEAEELTAAQVRAFLASLGYAERPCCAYPVCESMGTHTHHQLACEAGDHVIPDKWKMGRRSGVYGDQASAMLGSSLEILATLHAGGDVQALLSRINPRMRAGWPTDDELARHPFWLVGQPSIRVDLRVMSAAGVRARRDRLDPEFKDIGQPVCWPCDSRGNKVFRGPARKRESESGK